MSKTVSGTAIAWALWLCLLIAGCDQLRPIPAPPAGSYQSRTFSVQQGGKPMNVPGAVVTSTFFSTAGVSPVLGRSFIPEEFGPKGFPVALISYRFWQEQFRGDPSILGKTIQVDGRPLTLVGIMPENFDVPPGAGIWIPRVNSSTR